MKILGIDPGYGITGFGLLHAERSQFRLLRCGAITTPPNTDFYWRLGVIYNDMVQLLTMEKPDAVAIEELFFGHNVTTGIGVSISANKIKGIRCAQLSDLMSARLTREHNDTNMMALGAAIVGEGLALEIVDTWLDTAFSHGERHQRRIDKVMALEKEAHV